MSLAELTSARTKIALPPGLIRYSTEHAINNQFSLKQMQRRVLRPRVMIYSGLLLAIILVFFGSLLMRAPLKLDVIRDRGSLGREVDDGRIENVYRLQIMNTAETAHRFKLSVSGIETIGLATSDEVQLNGTESRAVPIRVRVAHGAGQPGSNKIFFELTAMDDHSLHVKEKAVFFVPR